ncbi:MAG TPA: outer membrane beta-barrel protein [Candidatus Eisenbacteria bacterium]
MKRILTGLMMVAALSITTAPGAEAAHPGFGLGVHGGYGESDGADSGSPLAGIHLTLNVTPWLGIVAMGDYKFEEDVTQFDQDFTIKSYPISGMARLYLPIESFSPYVAAGVQYRLISYGGDAFDDVEIDDSDDGFGWLAGAGAEFNLGTNKGLFVEGRFESFDPEQDVDNALDDLEELSYDQWAAIAGLTFYFK